MQSMTGYAYEEYASENFSVSVELKSYNSRFLDLNINLPSYLSRLENKFREICTQYISRGKVDIYIKIKEIESGITVKADTKAAISYATAISEIATALGRNLSDIPLQLIINQEGVLVSQHKYDIESYFNKIEPVFSKALTCFVSDREREGENLKKDILIQLQKIENSQKVFTSWIPKMEIAFKDNLYKKFKDMLGDNIDEQRIMTEIASLLVKYTINEEVVRLESHIQALKHEIITNKAPGRKIDFICQELNREINTIGSKNQFTEVGSEVISAKNSLENIREQMRNIE